MSQPKLVTLNQLHENTASVIAELYEKQEPFILTRRGRLLALVTPLPEGIEGELVAEYLKDNPLPNNSPDAVTMAEFLSGPCAFNNMPDDVTFEEYARQIHRALGDQP